ncbi:MAG: HD domain-containing protein [Candidatus Berkelbacteria bacterium]|nr:HD domain-containing protein [Candidatus Berkelbacteria bacterium]
MLIKDRIYGNFNIKEPVIIELIKSKPIQRLKGIAQFGLPDKYYFLKGYSRYEHSIGVMLLLIKLEANLEEQVAGLLHDISHSAFSHVFDWVVGTSESEDYQDSIHNKFMNQKKIKDIINKYHLNFNEITNLENFSLLEREIPNLCADRIDYSLREFPVRSRKYCLSNLTVRNNKIVFQNKKAAKLFGITFIGLQVNHWGSLEAVARYSLLADTLKKALKKKLIKKKDFLFNDKYIIDILKKDAQLKDELSVLKNKKLDTSILNRFINTKNKFRYVDPIYIEKDRLERLSKKDISFRKLIVRSR